MCKVQSMSAFILVILLSCVFVCLLIVVIAVSLTCRPRSKFI